MPASTSLTFMDSSILDIKHSPGIDGTGWIPSDPPGGTGCEFLSVCAQVKPLPCCCCCYFELLCLRAFLTVSPTAVRLMCRSWWTARPGPAGGVGPARPRRPPAAPTSSWCPIPGPPSSPPPPCSRPSETTRERLLFTRRELYSDLFLVGQTSRTWRNTSDSL